MQHLSTIALIFALSIPSASPPEVGIPKPVEVKEYKPIRSDLKPLKKATVIHTTPKVNMATGDSVWDKLAQCEAGGNWAINTGNGFYGGLQFTLQSWRGVGGSGYPHQTSREEQIKRGKLLQASQGWGAWPACSAKLGLR